MAEEAWKSFWEKNTSQKAHADMQTQPEGEFGFLSMDGSQIQFNINDGLSTSFSSLFSMVPYWSCPKSRLPFPC
jgi:hypothetical protein